MKVKKIRIGQLIFLLASACGLHGQDFDKMVDSLLDGSVSYIQPESLDLLKKNKKDIVILDAREKSEYDVSHIEGAIWVGYDDFDLSRVEVDKDKEVIVYCSVGYRSEKIGEKLQEDGYNHVSNLYGGIFLWKNEGYEIVDNSQKGTEKIHAYNKRWGKWVTNGEKVYDE